MDGILRLDKKWKWKVDIFLKKIVKSVEVESGKAEKWKSGLLLKNFLLRAEENLSVFRLKYPKIVSDDLWGRKLYLLGLWRPIFDVD